MNIIIIDDEKPVREYYKQICIAEGHTPVCFHDLIKAIQYIRTNPVDIIYLDNHFARRGSQGHLKAIYGVDYLDDIRIAKPHCFVVLMSSKQFSVEMIKSAVKHRIEFFIENPAAPEDIKETLRQIDLLRDREALVVRSVLHNMRLSFDAPESMFARILDALRSGRKPSFDCEVKYVSNTNELVLLSPMKRVAHVARGDEHTFKSTVSVIRSSELRADSKFGIGLTLGDSRSLLNTVIGAKIKSELEIAAGIRLSDAVTHSYTDEIKIALHDADIKKGAFSKDVYEGIVYERHILSIRLRHSRSGLEQQCELSCFVPNMVDIAICLNDELNVPLIDERLKYRVWDLPKMILDNLSR